MARPFAYLRKSSVRDPERDTSPESQEREVRALAQRNDGDVIADADLIADWDISGRAKYTSKRTGYLRLLKAIEQGEVSAVYSYSLSRLGRSVSELARFFDLCAARKVPVRLVVDSVDTSTASGRLLANVLASVAEFEAEVARERILASFKTRRDRAIAEGRDPVEAVRSSPRYGEKPEEGEDPGAVLAAYRETGSFSKAARVLNERGIKPRDAKAWWASSVAVVVERLDPEVRGRRSARGTKLASSEGFALARLLTCGTCGHMLTGSRLPNGQGGRRVRYACRFGEGAKHPRVTISESLILPAIEDEAALYRDPTEDDIESVERRRLALTDRRGRVLNALLDGVMARDEANAALRDIEGELARMDVPVRRDLRLPAGMTPREVNAVLRELFERIDLDPKTFQPVHFEWRNPDWRAE
jgi:DNA invertase Pin-like site-specific DNA recombinase